MGEQNNAIPQEVVSYEKSKIQLLFNILNSVNFTGIQQAQAIAQIAVILGEPITDNTDNKITDNSRNKESGD